MSCGKTHRVAGVPLVLSTVAALLAWGSVVQAQEGPPVPLEPDRASLSWEAAAVTAVVYNTAVPKSEELARLYATARNIPPTNLVGLEAPTKETIRRSAFESEIRDPLREIFRARGWMIPEADGGGCRIRILTVMYGMPLRIGWRENDPIDGQAGTSAASVDSELALIAAPDYELNGSVPNPYFKWDNRFADYDDRRLILTARLDGPSPEVVRNMINGPREAELSGLWGMAYVDLSNDRRPGYGLAEGWLKDTAKAFRAEGIPVITDRHEPRFPINYPMRDPIFYMGWYTNHLEGAFLRPGFRFPTGAVAVHIHSYSAASLRKEGKHWAGPLLQRGAAATLGNVWEPFLGGSTHLHLFTDRLLKGYTFVESAWMATPGISWMTVVLGDPLYRPFGTGRGLDDRESARPYKVSHLLAKVHGTGNPIPLLEELTRVGEGVAGTEPMPELIEAAGLILRERGDDHRARGYFEHAAALSQTAGDLLRNQLHIVDIYRSQGDRQRAVGLLTAMLQQPPDDPAVEAIRALKDELDPPPPPPTAATRGPVRPPEPGAAPPATPAVTR